MLSKQQFANTLTLYYYSFFFRKSKVTALLQLIFLPFLWILLEKYTITGDSVPAVFYNCFLRIVCAAVQEKRARGWKFSGLYDII